MIQEKTKSLIEQAATVELDNAVENFGESFVSTHEAYAVLLEEMEEVQDNIKTLTTLKDMLWTAVKTNRSTSHMQEIVDRMITYATHSVAELLQVEAVLNKTTSTLNKLTE